MMEQAKKLEAEFVELCTSLWYAVIGYAVVVDSHPIVIRSGHTSACMLSNS